MSWKFLILLLVRRSITPVHHFTFTGSEKMDLSLKYFLCAKCSSKVPISYSGDMGYGYLSPFTTLDDRICYPCMARYELDDLLSTGKGLLYLGKYTVTDWTGTLSLPITYQKKGRHNIAGTRYDVWFRVGAEKWYGVQYGENTQLIHCKRMKGGK